MRRQFDIIIPFRGYRNWMTQLKWQDNIQMPLLPTFATGASKNSFKKKKEEVEHFSAPFCWDEKRRTLLKKMKVNVKQQFWTVVLKKQLLRKYFQTFPATAFYFETCFIVFYSLNLQKRDSCVHIIVNVQEVRR